MQDIQLDFIEVKQEIVMTLILEACYTILKDKAFDNFSMAISARTSRNFQSTVFVKKEFNGNLGT